MNTTAYEDNRKRVAAARRAFRDAARAVVASGDAFADYDAFASRVNDQIAIDRAAIDTTARTFPLTLPGAE